MNLILMGSYGERGAGRGGEIWEVMETMYGTMGRRGEGGAGRYGRSWRPCMDPWAGGEREGQGDMAGHGDHVWNHGRRGEGECGVGRGVEWRGGERPSATQRDQPAKPFMNHSAPTQHKPTMLTTIISHAPPHWPRPPPPHTHMHTHLLQGC